MRLDCPKCGAKGDSRLTKTPKWRCSPSQSNGGCGYEWDDPNYNDPTLDYKYWNYPKGWDYVVKYLNHKGYKVLDIDLNEDQSRDGYFNKLPKGVIKSQGKPLDERISELIHCEFFIGLGSGLSWLAWAVNKWVIMIHGMTEPWFEFQHKCVHVHNDTVCNGCWHRDETLNLKGLIGLGLIVFAGIYTFIRERKKHIQITINKPLR